MVIAMPFMLSFPFHFPISLHRFSFLSASTHTNAYICTHHNYLSICFLSRPKHSVLSIGSTGYSHSTPLSKDIAPSVDFGLCEYDDDGDVVFEERDKLDASFVSKKEFEHDENVEEREEFDSSFVSNKEFPPWREVEDDSDDDEGSDVDTYFMVKKDLPPWGEVEDGDDDDGDVEGSEESDTSFVFSKKELPPLGVVEDDSDEDDNVVDDADEEGREDVGAYFVAKKELPPWGEAEDDGYRDSRPVVTTLSTSKEMGLVNAQRALFLEELDENVLSNRILVLSRTNKTRSAMEYFRSMELSGLCPNIHACNSLMSCLLRNGRFDDCFKVFNFTRKIRIATGHTYSLILMAHAKSRGCHSTLKFFKQLESECDVEKDFDAAVYNTMISICRKVENWSEIQGLWRSLKANECAGTLVTYRLLINSFVRSDQSELALYAYHEMVQNGFEPDSNTLNAIICVCAKEGKWDAALNIFEKMLTSELKPNLVACNSLINSLGRDRELKLAFQVYNTMKSLGHKPDAYTLNALLSSLNKANRQHEALKLYEMIERDQTTQFNIHLYNTVLASCLKLRLWDRALEVLWQIEASGLSDLTISYNLVIKTCELAGKPTVAFQVYEHMVHQKCSPNLFTYLSIIRCCICGDMWEELEEILNTVPNAALYNAAVQGMCSRGQVNLANKVYAKMLESGVQPDVRTQVLMHPMIKK